MRLILIIANNMNEYLSELIHWFSWIFNTINVHINEFSYSCLLIWWFNNAMQNFKHNRFNTFNDESSSMFAFSMMLNMSFGCVFWLFFVRFSIAIWIASLNVRHVYRWFLMNRYLNIFHVSLCRCRILLSAIRMKNINICCHVRT